jgi:hypothetical protein
MPGLFRFITGAVILAGSLFNLVQGALRDHAHARRAQRIARC